MNEETPHINLSRSRKLIDRLIQCGVTSFVICPGSRSTPLVFAVTERDDVATFVHFDERGAAFYALGRGRATGLPTAVITTSGTAVPNLMPATVEAANDRVPMILLTADRPTRLRHTGANQTIDQQRIFGGFADYVELDSAASLDPATASGIRSFPVHINCPFDEPLLPSPDDIRPLTSRFSAGANSDISTPIDRAVQRCAEFVDSATNGLVIAGTLRDQAETRAVEALATRLGWPLLPDITSGLRLGVDAANVIAHYDLILSGAAIQDEDPVDVFHIGGRFVSKRLLQWLQRARIRRYCLLGPYDERFDPAGCATDSIVAPVEPICSKLIEIGSPVKSSSTLDRWRKMEDGIARLLSEELWARSDFTGAAVAAQVAETTPEDYGLFLASSLPVRLVDWFAPSNGPRRRVAANRGASGIDGTVASAAGFAEGLDAPVVLLIGDQALLHDLNSLAMLSRIRYPVTVVVLNNGGGGIFDHLPVSEHKSIFEKHFVNAHNLRFEDIARQFGLDYSGPSSIDEFMRVFRQSLERNTSGIIEVVTDRRLDQQQHQRIIDAIKERLSRE